MEVILRTFSAGRFTLTNERDQPIDGRRMDGGGGGGMGL